MSSIGPQLPPHLLERGHASRTPADAAGTKILDDDDDDAPGPQPEPEASIGPQIPTQFLTSRGAPPAAVDESEDEEDDYGPALPPDLLPLRSGPVAGPSLPPPQAKRVLGPSFPGHDRGQHGADEDDEDDDGYGPMPLPEGAQRADALSEGVREFMEKEERRRKEVEEAAKPKKLQRDEWMLVPPSSSDLLGHLGDPTKLKARQFSRGAGAASRSAPNNLWTETPAERQQRIADEVAGKKRRAANADDDVGADAPDEHKKRKRDEDIRRVVDEHNKSARNKSLLDLHSSTGTSSKKSKKGEEEGPPVIWDHSRDMSVGGRLMDEKQRGKLIADARSLGDRFGSGKAGGYL